MRIAYCTNVRLPSERAHGHQVARVCDALVKLGHEVIIFAPFRKNPQFDIRNTFQEFHETNVELRRLGTFDPINRWYIPKFFQLLLLNFLLCRGLRKTLKAEKFELLYTRSPALFSTLLATKTPVILELHSLPRRGRRKFVERCNHCALVVCLTTPMQKELISWGVDQKKVIVEADAVDFAGFEGAVPLSSETLHNLPADTECVGYVGQLESMGLSKGISELFDAIALLQNRGHNMRLLIAGPPSSIIERLASHKAKAMYFGFLPHNQIPSFLAVCKVLVYPAPASDHPFFQRDTSPLKIFEYMAARKPIVAADLPPLRDILSEETAFLCKPGDPEGLAFAIEKALSNPEEAKTKVECAWQFVQEHTWEKRMKRIVEGIRKQ